MNYLSAEDILVVHALLVDETGGMHGVRDTHLLSSIIARPQMSVGGSDAYPDVFSKAGVYLESIARHHVFVDGNKRTSFVVAVRFLYLNGYVFEGLNEEIEGFVLQV